MKTSRWNATNEPVEQNGINGVHTLSGKCVALTENGVHRKHDALLITDALNIIQKCDLMPSELLKQRDELLQALKFTYQEMSEWERKENSATGISMKLIKQIEQ